VVSFTLRPLYPQGKSPWYPLDSAILTELSRLILIKYKIYKIIISPVRLYGCDNSSLILREEHRLMAFENKVLGCMFGPKKEEVT
jgi:hypothetical protein